MGQQHLKIALATLRQVLPLLTLLGHLLQQKLLLLLQAPRHRLPQAGL
jgi:hypothetical protein